MTSAEPGRRKAYACDLRWRIVYQRLASGLPYVEIAKNLSVSTSTVYRVFRFFEATGAVDPSSPQPTGKKLDAVHAEVYVVGLILESPALRLSEVCHDLLEVFGIEVSPSTVCRLLRSYGFTRKKSDKLQAKDVLLYEEHLWHSVTYSMSICLCGSMKPDLMLETALESMGMP